MNATFWNAWSWEKRDKWCLSQWDGSMSTSTTSAIWLTTREEAELSRMPREIRNDWYLDNEHRAVEIETGGLLPF